MKKIIVVTLLLASVISNCFAQTKSTQELQINDIVPDLSFTVSEGGKDIKRKLSDYKGKIVLFDFWGVNCTSCIASMPKMLELQKKFKENIQIILVTYNSDAQIQKLWKTLESLPFATQWISAGKQLPFIKNDSIIRKLFPHKVIPTHVWLGKKREFISISYSSSTTEGNIKKLIAGQSVNWDDVKGVDITAEDLINNPLMWFEEKAGVKDRVPYYSFITPRIEFGEGGFAPTQLLFEKISGKLQGISCVNETVLDLYKEAYRDKLPFQPIIPDNRVVFEVAEKSKYVAPPYDSTYYYWANKNVFCYALRLSVDSAAQIYSVMKKDLDRFFKIESSIEKRKIKCWVLKKLDSKFHIQSKGGKEKYEKAYNRIILQNHQIRSLFYALEDIVNVQYPQMPFLDLTGYSGAIDIELPWKEDVKEISIPELRKSLQLFGLDMVEEYRIIDMLLIREVFR
ncbi:MAG: TlpA family protein disulfide reductase [Chitinophagaceae bacterium]|nr:TlpA family protein disulfide reductase [Chitinophagaceae bacterium]